MLKNFKQVLIAITFVLAVLQASSQNNVLVFQSDFGLKDGAVSAMKGVATGISPTLKIYDLTHEIPAYNIWEAGYRLEQTAQYWPKGTVFVSVVDPGVGSQRKSVVLKTKSGHFFVGPDNGQFSMIAESLGIDEIHEIDEVANRRKNSGASYTFHGRDVYAFTGAKLAAKLIDMNKVGPKLPSAVIKINYQKAVFEDGKIKGNIPILDVQYGNVWTNIDQVTFKKLDLKYGDLVNIEVKNKDQKVWEGAIPYETSFSAVETGKPIAYLNSLLNFAFALNQGNFAATYKIESGPDWSVVISKSK